MSRHESHRSASEISNMQVVQAYHRSETMLPHKYPYEHLEEMTSKSQESCIEAMERAEDLGLTECGVSLRTGWLTEEGRELLRQQIIKDDVNG